MQKHKAAALAVLTLLMAACSQAPTPTAPTATATHGIQGNSYATSNAANDALIDADLQRLGLNGGVSAQAIAPQVYLNVLPVPSSADSVRAYVKSTFTSPVTCSLDWGDGSAAAPFASPTTLRIDTRDHAYMTFGTYTLTVTCLNGATVVGTQSVTLQAGKKATRLDFDAPVAPNGGLNRYATYQEKGFNIFTDQGLQGSQDVIQFSPTWGGYNLGPTQALNNDFLGVPMHLTTADGTPFTLMSFDFRPLSGSSMTSTVVGLKKDGTTVTAPMNSSTTANTHVVLDGSWTNLSQVTFNDGESWLVIDNVNVSK